MLNTSVGVGANSGLLAVSQPPQVTLSQSWQAVGCHYLYFPPGLQLPSQAKSITALWLVPDYTAWSQFVLVYFRVRCSKISDNTHKFLLNYGSLFWGLLLIRTQCTKSANRVTQR